LRPNLIVVFTDLGRGIRLRGPKPVGFGHQPSDPARGASA
jgi:hypothetical protein